jgi:glycosyltransferase involved in cell wall biosynthesis
MKILYLYTDLIGYQIPIFKEYVDKYNAQVHVIHWDHKKKTLYIPELIKNVTYYKRSEFTKSTMKQFALNLNPEIVYISGWMDNVYLAVAKMLKKKGVPIIPGFDDIWKGTYRQRIASIIFPIIRKLYFSYAWVAGPYQYEYARKLGFKKDHIIFNCLSADVNLFKNSYFSYKEKKNNKYPHRFLYAGRFEPIKGTDILIQAWENIKEKRKDWQLCIIGNGSLKNMATKYPDIIVKDFMQPEELINEVENSGCFILPSRSEQWGLVLQEFALAGLPIICSDICGGAPVFVIPNYNGFTFRSEDIKSLENKMIHIINTSDQNLIIMSDNSNKCGFKITPEMSAASFMSVLEK